MSTMPVPFTAQELEQGNTPQELRDKAVRLEEVLRGMPEHHIQIPVTHRFTPGMYSREVRLPAGSIVTGKIHRTKHIAVIAKGKVAVLTEKGTEIFEAPTVLVTEPGTKRAVHCIEDAVWITFHPTHETDLVKLEAELIAPDFDSLEAPRENKLLEKRA